MPASSTEPRTRTGTKISSFAWLYVPHVAPLYHVASLADNMKGLCGASEVGAYRGEFKISLSSFPACTLGACFPPYSGQEDGKSS